MKFLGSIRARFTGWYLIVLAILLIAMSIGTYLVLRHTLVVNLDESLARRAEELFRQPEFIGQLLNGRFEPPLSEVIGLFVPSNEGWEAVGQRLPDKSIAEPTIEAAASGIPTYLTIGREDEPEIRYLLTYYIHEAPPLDDPQNPTVRPPSAQIDRPEPLDLEFDVAVLIVGRPTDVTVSALGALRNTLLLAVPLTLLLSASGGLFLVRRALRPVDQMITTTRTI